MAISENIKIKRAARSKIAQTDFADIPLGRYFTDHMFTCNYEEGKWKAPRIEPLAPVPTHPAAMALHYGQAIFEGTKATLHTNGVPLLFRPKKNAERLNQSAHRMSMPHFPEKLFVESLKQLVKLDRNWIPPQEGSGLYLRPFMYANEPFIGMRPAAHYKFTVIASPAVPLFNKRIKLRAEKKYIRAARGGTGQAKAAGNYAAALRPAELAKADGYDQVLWLDAHRHKYIQEVGTMNIFFKIEGKFITPHLDGCVLKGITRTSVIELLEHMGHEVTERAITIDEIAQAAQNGALEEAFGTGTAVGIAHIEAIGWGKKNIHVGNQSPVASAVRDLLNRIKTGRAKDHFGWTVAVQ
ncbi:MAG: branched-chain amino acid aminotransferase [Marinirhabdus sp.]